jgi:UDP-glucose 4-epimerase
LRPILVTGGAGFIGSDLVRQLKARGHGVIVVDNLVNGRRENLEEVLDESVHLEVADIRDTSSIATLFQNVECIFHLACLGVRHSIHSPEENASVNAAATLDLLREARRAHVPRFVYVSSSEVYGTARTVPMASDHPTFPTTVYGSAKLAGECYARAYFHTYGYPTTVVRPFNSYGPRSHHEGDCGEVVPKFVLRTMAGLPLVIFGDGTQTRDFTYVSDTAAGILAAGFSDAAVGRTLNLGSGRETRICDLARTVAKVLGREDAQVIHDAPRPGDVMRLYADSTEAAELLGFQPRLTLEEGIRRLHQWYLEKGVSAEELLRDEVVHNWERKGDEARA